MEVIDLSVFPLTDMGTALDEKQAEMVRRAFKAFRETGFLAVTGHGLSKEEFHLQFDLGRLLLDDVSEEEKQALHAKVPEGSWAGYKVWAPFRR